MTHRIAVIGGDGIGPEVISVALDVIAAAGAGISTTEFELGGHRYLRDGTVLDDETLEELRTFDAILLGAVGTPEVPPGVIERGLLLKARFELDLYVNLRPFTLPDGHSVRVAGWPVARQHQRGRSGTGFVTIEDEEGDVQLIIWPKVFARYRRALGSRVILARGTVSRYDGTTNVIASHIQVVPTRVPLPSAHDWR